MARNQYEGIDAALEEGVRAIREDSQRSLKLLFLLVVIEDFPPLELRNRQRVAKSDSSMRRGQTNRRTDRLKFSIKERMTDALLNKKNIKRVGEAKGLPLETNDDNLSLATFGQLERKRRK